ncbi:MAG: TolC family protein, partial [Gammaproteobacteria bacterium]|nr:TolC family protein [Gammaproteobacteria bacterium]
IDPSATASDSSSNDSRLRLKLRKRLYDFGRTRAAVAAASAGLRGHEWLYLHARQEHYLEIMTRFFDVLLADLENAREAEATAVAFSRFDKARDRGELGQMSDVDLLKLESAYQGQVQRRTASAMRQRTTRSLLAIALNRPGQLPSELEMPQLSALERSPEKLEILTQLALAQAPRLRALREQVVAADEKVQAAQAENNGVLRGELEAAAWARRSGSHHPLSAQLVLEIPLYAGGAVAAKVARQRALVREKRAILHREKQRVRQTVLELWMELDTLLAERKALAVLGDYRDLYLDRSRALYELEVATDLGDAMTRISDYRLRKAKNEFRTTLVWARLDALTDRLPMPEDSGVGVSNLTGEK